MSPTRRNVLKWGAGAGGGALAATLGLPGIAGAATTRTPGREDGWIPVIEPSTWMSRLKDSISLVDLTIPGTHDSCCTNPINGTEWSHTQNWGLPEQFQRGIRFLDIRCNGLAGTASEMGIYHADSYQYIRLQDVLDQCRSFLRSHPGETIVMRLKNEDAGGNRLSGVEFQRRFNYYMDTLGYRGLFWLEGQWPNLGQARGKIVLAADFDNPNWWVVQWASGSDTNKFFSTQDHYQGLSPYPQGKIKVILDWFDHAFINSTSPQMFVNFTSYADGALPRANAAVIMPSVYNYLNARTQEVAHFGIVPMDFPDLHTDVLELLIAKNFVGR